MVNSLGHSAAFALIFFLGSFLDVSSASGDTAVSLYPINCTHLPNGQYVRGCSDHFFSCVNGLAYPAQCVNEEVMNPTTGLCQARINTSICALAMAEMKLYKVNSPLDCSSAPYGSYPSGFCTPQFNHCGLGGYLEKLTCPAGFVFDYVSRDEPICNQPTKCQKAMVIKRPWQALVVAEPAPEPVTIATPSTSPPPPHTHFMRRNGPAWGPISDETDADSHKQVPSTGPGTDMDSLYESRLRDFARQPSDDNYDAAVGVLELTEKAFDVGSKHLAYVDKLIELKGKLARSGYTENETLSESRLSLQQSQQRTSLIRHSHLWPIIDDSTDYSNSSTNGILSSPTALESRIHDYIRQPTEDNYDAAMGVLMLAERAYEVRTKELAYVDKLRDVEEKLEKGGYVKEGHVNPYIAAFMKRYREGQRSSIKPSD